MKRGRDNKNKIAVFLIQFVATNTNIELLRKPL